MQQSDLEETFLYYVKLLTSLPPPVRQFAAIPGRKFRFDFAWPVKRLLVEIQGGIWTQGGHSRGAGMKRDHEKANMAAALGYRVMYFNSDFADDPETHVALVVAAYQWGSGVLDNGTVGGIPFASTTGENE